MSGCCRSILSYAVGFAALMMPTGANAQLLFRESFGYAASAIVGEAGSPWTQFGTEATPVAQTVSGGLTYPGLLGTQGNHAELQHAAGVDGQDIKVSFSPVSGDGNSLFVSFLYRQGQIVPSPPTWQDIQNIGLAPTTATAESDIVCGILSRSNSPFPSTGVGPKWGYGNNPLETLLVQISGANVYFVVLEYQFIAGAANDNLRLWINPALGVASPPTPTMTLANSGATVPDATSLGMLILRQTSIGSGTSDGMNVDEIRIGPSWADVASATVPVSLSKFEAE